MILSGSQIKRRIGKQIIITPFNHGQLNPNSYNLRLGDTLLMYTKFPLDMREKLETEKITIPKTGYIIEPNRLYLGSTQEYTETHGLVPLLEGRSSIGRLGMSVHLTAGFGDVGFCGYWTLEISTLHPLRIYAGVEVCQIFYHTIKRGALSYQSNKYQHNRGIQPSLLYKELNRAQ